MVTVTPSLHDGNLVGIEIDGSDINISFRTEDGQPLMLKLRSVQYFKCDDFREGNIVLDVEIERAGDIEPEELAALFFADPTLSQTDAIVSKAKSLDWKSVAVSASYGAIVMGICESAEMTNSLGP